MQTPVGHRSVLSGLVGQSKTFCFPTVGFNASLAKRAAPLWAIFGIGEHSVVIEIGLKNNTICGAYPMLYTKAEAPYAPASTYKIAPNKEQCTEPYTLENITPLWQKELLYFTAL